MQIYSEFALGRRRKLAKKERILPIFRKIGRDFGKIRGNFKRFCSEKKTIWKVIGRIFW